MENDRHPALVVFTSKQAGGAAYSDPGLFKPGSVHPRKGVFSFRVDYPEFRRTHLHPSYLGRIASSKGELCLHTRANNEER